MTQLPPWVFGESLLWKSPDLITYFLSCLSFHLPSFYSGQFSLVVCQIIYCLLPSCCVQDFLHQFACYLPVSCLSTCCQHPTGRLITCLILFRFVCCICLPMLGQMFSFYISTLKLLMNYAFGSSYLLQQPKLWQIELLSVVWTGIWFFFYFIQADYTIKSIPSLPDPSWSQHPLRHFQPDSQVRMMYIYRIHICGAFVNILCINISTLLQQDDSGVGILESIVALCSSNFIFFNCLQKHKKTWIQTWSLFKAIFSRCILGPTTSYLHNGFMIFASWCFEHVHKWKSLLV